jgi:hypothetical protein
MRFLEVEMGRAELTIRRLGFAVPAFGVKRNTPLRILGGLAAGAGRRVGTGFMFAVTITG